MLRVLNISSCCCWQRFLQTATWIPRVTVPTLLSGPLLGNSNCYCKGRGEEEKESSAAEPQLSSNTWKFEHGNLALYPPWIFFHIR